MIIWHVHLDLNEDYPTSKDGVLTNYTMDAYGGSEMGLKASRASSARVHPGT